jgi:hypothetical protein
LVKNWPESRLKPQCARLVRDEIRAIQNLVLDRQRPNHDGKMLENGMTGNNSYVDDRCLSFVNLPELQFYHTINFSQNISLERT